MIAWQREETACADPGVPSATLSGYVACKWAGSFAPGAASCVNVIAVSGLAHVPMEILEAVLFARVLNFKRGHFYLQFMRYGLRRQNPLNEKLLLLANPNRHIDWPVSEGGPAPV